MSENVDEPQVQEEHERVFTQAELDRIVTERLERDRKNRSLSPEQVKEMKQQLADAEVKMTGAEKLQARVSELETKLSQSEMTAARARIQASYGITDEDAELFLIGTDAETIEKQAKALSERLANAAPGHTPEGSNNRPKSSEERSFIRGLTGRS